MAKEKKTKDIKKIEKKGPSLISKVTLIIVVAIFIILNATMVKLSEKKGLRIDMTKEATFSLSEKSKEFLKNLDDDIKITVLAQEQIFTANDQIGSFGLIIYETLLEMDSVSDHVSVQFVDFLKHPEYSAQHPELELKQSDVLIEGRGKFVKIDPMDMLLVTENETGLNVVGSSAEQVLLSKILSLTSDKMTRVGIIEGFNELSLDGFKSLLEYNNYRVEGINLLSEKIDEEIETLIFAAPEIDITEEQAKVLNNFLENGGKKGKTLMYFASAVQPELPNLDYFLKEWGISIGKDVIIETDQSKMLVVDNPLVSIADVVESPYTAEFAENDNAVITFPVSRPVEILFENQSTRSVTPVVMFGESTYLLDVSEDAEKTDEKIRGPFVGMAISSNFGDYEDEDVSSSVIVSGTVESIGSSYLSTTIVGNSDFYMTILNQFHDRENSFVIQDKLADFQVLNMTAAQVDFLKIIFIVVLPVTLLALGFVEWWNRRRK